LTTRPISQGWYLQVIGEDAKQEGGHGSIERIILEAEPGHVHLA
jgi:hypothetical protein